MSQKTSIQSQSKSHVGRMDLLLAFEVFHDVQESVIDVGMFDKSNLYLIQIAQRVLRSG